MSTYKITVRPLQERSSLIATEISSPIRTHRIHEFRNTATDLPVIRIPIDVPVYRMANYRTNILQLRWLKEKKLQGNYFSGGEENESIQKVQHEFLWDLAQTQKESISSIIEKLQTEGQRQPIMISASGVVVNGNRRLAAMRESIIEFPDFAFVDCMVLPPYATEDDLKDIEVRLQMTPETRLPYSWISELLAVKDLKSRDRSVDTIAELMGLNPPTKVTDKLLMLTEIELYLKEWKNQEFDYDQVLDAEEIISQAASRLKKKDGIQKEIARHIAWLLLDQRGKEGRIYELRDTTGTLTPAVVSKLQEVYSSELTSNIPNENGSGDLEFELEGGEESNDQNIIAFLKSSRGDEAKQESLINLFKAVVDSHKTKQAGNAALKSATDAHTRLVEIDLTSADKTTYQAIRNQLDAIESRVSFLKAELSRYDGK